MYFNKPEYNEKYSISVMRFKSKPIGDMELIHKVQYFNHFSKFLMIIVYSITKHKIIDIG